MSEVPADQGTQEKASGLEGLATGQLVRRMGRLVRKEVSTILRDRRTIITLVLMPLLLYPLLTIAFRQFLLATTFDQTTDPDYRIGFLSEDEGKRFQQYIREGELVLQRRNQRAATGKKGRATRVPIRPFSWFSYETPDLEGAVLGRQVDLGIRFPPEGAGNGRRLRCEILVLRNSFRGADARALVEGRLSARNVDLLEGLLHDNPRIPSWIVAVDPQLELLAEKGGGEAIPLSALVPLILILMTITGAVYPAIDLTAGERERGTLEILVAAPIPRLGLLFAKYVSVVTVAVLTALANLVTMTVTLWVSGLGATVFGSVLTFGVIIQVFFLLLLFAAFFSAVLLAVTSFARSFKEAQAYLIPLMLVSLTPGMLSLTGIQLKGGMVVVPLLNIVLLARDIFSGGGSAGVAALVVLTTLVYAGAAIALAAHIFGAEAVLYNEQTAWSDLFRRPPRERAVPLVSTALGCLALLFPAWFVLSGLLLQMGDVGAQSELLTRGVATLVLFGGFPLVAVWLRRVRLITGFRLDRSGIRAWGPAILFGLSLWPFALVLNRLLEVIGASTLTPQMLTMVGQQLDRWRALSPVFVVGLAAVVPAILEELFFRGFLFSALLDPGRPRTAIVGSALFFGLFHLVGQQLLIVEWGVMATLLGLVLGWLAWRSGSVLPGMFLHALHNSCLVLLGYYKPALIAAGWIGEKQTEAPVLWLVLAAGGCAGATVWLKMTRKEQ
jgi:sodium transport system permease protein